MVKNLFVLFILISFSSFSQDSDRKKDFIDLFPNPAKDYINIKLTNDRKLEDCTFSIHSLIGNKMNLDSEVISDNEMRISIGEFNQGFFFLLVDDKIRNKRKIIKFLKVIWFFYRHNILRRTTT